MAIRKTVGGGGALLGQIINITTAAGDEVFDWEGDRWVRSDTIVVDDNDLAPELQGLKTYTPAGGQNTFNETLGATLATTVNNSSGTVIIRKYNSLSGFRSTDNGETFSSNSVPQQCLSDIRDCMSVSPVTGTIITNALQGSNQETIINRSTNDGLTYSEINIVTNDKRNTAVVFCDSTGKWHVIADQGVYYHSTTDGVSWTLQTALPSRCYTMCETPSGRLVVGGENGAVYYSDDGGTVYATATGTLAGDLRAMSYIGDNGGSETLIAVSNIAAQSVVSYDEGATWQQYTPVLAFGSDQGSSYCIWSDGTGKVVIGVIDTNYDGSKDRTVVCQSNDFGATLTQASVVEMNTALGLAEGADERLFMSSRNYSATDHPEPYVYLGEGFSSGGDPNNLLEACLIKEGV